MSVLGNMREYVVTTEYNVTVLASSRQEAIKKSRELRPLETELVFSVKKVKHKWVKRLKKYF